MITKPDVASSALMRKWEKAAATGNWWTMLKVAQSPLASLRLTVALFGMSLFLVWVGTVAQQELSMWQVIQRYFHSWVAWVEFRHVFPEVFFAGAPNLYHAVTPRGGFFFPGGITLGLALFVNLEAAHLIRFEVRARGKQFAVGLAAMVVAVLWCILLIGSGQAEGSLQDKPPIEWDTLWLLLKLLAAGIAAAAVGGAAWLARTRRRQGESLWSLDVVLASSLSLMLAALVAALWLSNQTISHGSMRILYHLAQGLTCGAGLLVASYLLFGRRGGVVTIHLGIGLLMFGELLVSLYAVEEQITMADGESRAYAIDIRSVELAVIDRSRSDRERITVVPMTYKETPTEWAKGRTASDSALPFTIKVVAFYPNADLFNASPGESNRATRGIGKRVVARPAKGNAGADMEGTVAAAAAYVELRERGSGKDLGTYLLAQQLSLEDRLEPVSVGDRIYWLALRFRRSYKPYTVTLIDVRKDDYVGTNTPRWYSSTVRLQAPKYDFDETLTISMNNPIRFAGETFYQSGYHLDPKTGRESTTLQVVTNIGWLIPYIACGIVMVGLGAHFSMVFLRFLRRWSPPALHAVGWRPLTVGGISAAIIFAALLRPAREPLAGWELNRFGRLPVVAKGRAKPYDTLARASLRILASRESVRFEGGKKIAAIVWLLDVISGKPEAKEYPVFKIDNREVQQLLKLLPRSGNRFSLEEIEPELETLFEQAGKAQRTDRKLRTPYQRKVLELWAKIDLVMDLQNAFAVLPDDLEGMGEYELAELIARTADRVVRMQQAQVPYAVPRNDARQPWEPLMSVAARQWMRRVMQRMGTDDPAVLAEKLVAGIRRDEKRMKELVEAKTLAMIVDILSSQHRGKKSRREIETIARERLAAMPDDMRANVLRMSRKRLTQDLDRLGASIAAAARQLLGAHPDPRGDAMAERLQSALIAYRRGDAKTFNDKIAEVEQDFLAHGGNELNMRRVRFEAAFNHVAPFFWAIPVYTVALVLGVIGFVPLFRSLRWFTLGILVVTCLWHFGALAGRVYIAGRPPVTNLYSSTVYIAWGAVALGIVVEIAYRIGVGNVGASFAAIFGLLLGRMLATEVPAQSGDTFTVMQAVLDTQFWLATHVLCISTGYVTTLIAGVFGALAIGWSLWRAAWIDETDPGLAEVARKISRAFSGMIYFVVCLGIFFSFVGTVLGGLWGDDSWGRFWGWDPKENGALMIVLWNAIILHARWGGLVKGRGLAVLATGGLFFLGWSWMGVNELGFGLHSYGQTEGVIFKLVVSWVVVLFIAAVGTVIPRKAFQ